MTKGNDYIWGNSAVVWTEADISSSLGPVNTVCLLLYIHICE